MSKKQAKKLLESQRKKLEGNLKKFVEAEKGNVATEKVTDLFIQTLPAAIY